MLREIITMLGDSDKRILLDCSFDGMLPRSVVLVESLF